MDLENWSNLLLPAIERELEEIIEERNEQSLDGLFSMLTYHLGWGDNGIGHKGKGKRIRPLLVLLTNDAANGNWEVALPAAAGVELVHNFSLIHDDIQDKSVLRRGQETVWVRWGESQAINAGDAMFVIALQALQRLNNKETPDLIVKASDILLNACLNLTMGQYLDLDYEKRDIVSLDDYWLMIEKKTAGLIGASTELGALIAGANEKRLLYFRNFGFYLGLAFQAQDDYLGIWGNSALMGKSNESDLISGKKSMPVLYGLNHIDSFNERWRKGGIKKDDVPYLADILDKGGAKSYTNEKVQELTQKALNALDKAYPQSSSRQALRVLSEKLLKRSN